MTSEPLSNELGSQPATGVERLVVVGPTRYLPVGAERAEADQLVARKQRVESGFWVQQPLRVCLDHVVALVGRGVAPTADFQRVCSREGADLHGREGPRR